MNPSAREEKTISGVIGVAHDHVDAALAEVRRALDDGETERAVEGFAAIEREMIDHIRVEEEVLFPIFDARTGVVGPTAVMRDEHRRIEGWMASVRAALNDRRLDEADEKMQQLVILLRQHHLKEEKILYPKTDAAISAQERSELADWLRRTIAHEAP